MPLRSTQCKMALVSSQFASRTARSPRQRDLLHGFSAASSVYPWSS